MDPMCGSGTVVRHASQLGHSALAFDTDPLAVLMTKVWTTPIDADRVQKMALSLVASVRKMTCFPTLPWMDKETELFIGYWFAGAQRRELLRLARAIFESQSEARVAHERAAFDVLRLALSRLIVTKDKGASLARDVSHSRPHRVFDISDFEVVPAFVRSVGQLCKRLTEQPGKGSVRTELGDARALTSIPDASIDLVLSSPPYLNAIDYLRGHRLALIWLGYNLTQLRSIRSGNIGSERGTTDVNSEQECIIEAMGELGQLPPRYRSMIARYATDLSRVLREMARVVRPSGNVILVVGNSCLKGTFIRNANAVVEAAKLNGLRLLKSYERTLPAGNRYLPMPSTPGALSKRIRTESLLHFRFA
jgi:hypothetical protein